MTPEDSTNEIETLLRRQVPDAPKSLRQNVAASVEERLKRQTFLDDMKWLGMCSGILIFAIGCQWLVFKTASNRLVEFSDTELASSDSSRLVPSITKPSTNTH